MAWNDTIELISTIAITNEVGDSITVENKQKIYANKKSVRQSEFYQAMSNDLKPEIMFEITAFEYNEELQLIYNKKRYNVLRTFHTGGDRLELVCEGA